MSTDFDELGELFKQKTILEKLLKDTGIVRGDAKYKEYLAKYAEAKKDGKPFVSYCQNDGRNH